jgi:group I intron endonuclease
MKYTNLIDNAPLRDPIPNGICGIYAIVDIVNEKLYIGSSLDIRGRWRGHRSNLSLHRGNRRLQAAYDAHGSQALVFIVVEFVNDVSLLKARELAWFNATQCCNPAYGYNIASDPITNAASEETRERQRQAKLGKKRADSFRETMRIRSTGQKHSQEHIEASRKAMTGRKFGTPSDETKRKLSAALKGRSVPAETRARMSAGRTGLRFTPERLARRRENPIYLKIPRSERARIRERLTSGTKIAVLAREYGVDPKTIANIRDESE